MKKQGCENTFLPSGFLLPSTRPIFDSGIITLPSLRKWETLSLYFSPNSNFTQQRYRWKDSPDTEDIFRAVPWNCDRGALSLPLSFLSIHTLETFSLFLHNLPVFHSFDPNRFSRRAAPTFSSLFELKTFFPFASSLLFPFSSLGLFETFWRGRIIRIHSRPYSHSEGFCQKAQERPRPMLRFCKFCSKTGKWSNFAHWAWQVRSSCLGNVTVEGRKLERVENENEEAEKSFNYAEKV